jgi:hypothetical protein
MAERDADDVDALHRRYYRWWTVTAWRYPRDCHGLKLGPVTVCRYRWRAHWWWCVTTAWRREPVWDRGLRAMKAEPQRAG